MKLFLSFALTTGSSLNNEISFSRSSIVCSIRCAVCSNKSFSSFNELSVGLVESASSIRSIAANTSFNNVLSIRFSSSKRALSVKSLFDSIDETLSKYSGSSCVIFSVNCFSVKLFLTIGSAFNSFSIDSIAASFSCFISAKTSNSRASVLLFGSSVNTRSFAAIRSRISASSERSKSNSSDSPACLSADFTSSARSFSLA